MFKFVLYLWICVNFKGVYNVNWVIEWFIIFVDEINCEKYDIGIFWRLSICIWRYWKNMYILVWLR